MKFLTIQSTYDALQLALLTNDQLLDQISITKFEATAQFVIKLQELLSNNHLKLTDLPFISVNIGPGPFTTLRVVISSVNGLSFAKQIPLIGIDALGACIQEWADPQYPYTIVLLNAFSNDVYYAITQPNQKTKKGYKNIIECIENLKQSFPDTTLRFLGNGALLHHKLIKKLLADRALISDTAEYCSIKQIGVMGYALWKQKNIGAQSLLPLYLKNHPMQQ